MRSLREHAYAWRGRILLVAGATGLISLFFGTSIFDAVKPFGFSDPDSESSRATEVLEASTGERPLPDVVLLVEPASPGALARSSRDTAGLLAGVPDVVRVQTATDDPALLSDDGGAALVLGYLDADTEDIAEVGEQVEERFSDVNGVTVGGGAVTAHQLNETTEEDLRDIELLAAPLLFLLSLLVFRGLVAALLPIVVGLLSILSTLLMLRLLTNLIEVDVFVINIVTGLGLGLAIDYSLFVVSRFREELGDGADTAGALDRTIGATGRMILFSGLTVAAALIALCVFPQRFLYSIGLGGALVALTSCVVCLTVLPAMLGVLGQRVNALAPRGLRLRAPSPSGTRQRPLALRRPLLIAIVVTAVMIVAGLPFLRVELTRADASVLPEDSSAHAVDLAVEERFAADPASQLTIVIQTATPDQATIAQASRQLTSGDAVTEVSRPIRVADAVLRLDAPLGGDPFSEQALDAAGVARAADWGDKTLVGGPPAELADQRASLEDHLPTAIAIIVCSTLLLIFALTRSVVLPFVSLLMNALTVSVAFGVLVFVFQDGRLEGVLDYTSQGALDTSMPILLFAVAFGLSTDYGVFLLQRISEARDAGHYTDAIEIGLARTGRVITVAALLFAVAMGAFAFSDLIYVKQVAVGTAVAVLVDATIVRALLLPAVLWLLGPAAWWNPWRRAKSAS